MKDIEAVIIALLSIILITIVIVITISLCSPLNDAYYQISAKQCDDVNGTYTMEEGCIDSNGSRILNTVNLTSSGYSQKSHNK